MLGEDVVGEEEEELARPERDEGTSAGTAPKRGELKGGGEGRVRPPVVVVEGSLGRGSLSFLSHASEQ